MAGRELTAGVLSAISAGVIRPALFYQGEFVATGTETPAYLRLWTGVGDVSWNGSTWVGGGNLLGISPVEESSALQAKGFSVSLSGMPSETVAIALANIRQGKPGTLWLAFFDAAGVMIADPYQLQSGKLDISVIEDNGDTCTIAVQYESRLIDLEKPRTRYYTTEDQRLDYPEDRGFEFVPSLQEKVIQWG